MPNATLRRAAETKQAVVVLPRHNTVIEIVNIQVGLIKHT